MPAPARKTIWNIVMGGGSGRISCTHEKNMHAHEIFHSASFCRHQARAWTAMQTLFIPQQLLKWVANKSEITITEQHIHACKRLIWSFHHGLSLEVNELLVNCHQLLQRSRNADGQPQPRHVHIAHSFSINKVNCIPIMVGALRFSRPILLGAHSFAVLFSGYWSSLSSKPKVILALIQIFL